jgi:tetratricopeptide (TPR) repeat protein
VTDAQIASLHDQAAAAVRRRDYATASDLCEQMLERRRDDAGARMMLSQIALALGQRNAAVEHLRQAVRADPKNPALGLRLGQTYGMLARYAKAHDALDRVLKLDPGHAGAIAAKAMVYERQDKYDKARTLLKPHVRPDVKLDPELAAVHARVLIHDGDAAGAVALGRRLLEVQPQTGGGLRNAYFSVLKAFEAEGDYDTAFEIARRANAIGAVPFDVEAFRAAIDHTIALFDRARLAALPRPETRSDLPVFIVGMPRCGSTLTERILHAHPDVFGAGETPELHLVFDDLPKDLGSPRPFPDCLADLTPEAAERNATAYLDAMRAYDRKAKRIVNKHLGAWRHLGPMSVLFPAGRIIHCHRSPVDTCLSCYTERLTVASNPFSTDLATLGRYYREYERLMAHWRDVLDAPLLEVGYEDLVADQEPLSRSIIEFLGVAWDDACLRFHELKRHDNTLSYDQVRRPLYSSSVGRADRYGALLDPLREALAGRG